MKKTLLLTFILLSILSSQLSTCYAQVGEYRNVFAVGINGGYVLNRVSFDPSISQQMHGGMTIGLTGRYTCEKYYSTICSLQMELNFTQLGWKEKIENYNGGEVINPETKVAEDYNRTITYVEIPFMMHLAWGKEKHGVNGFFEAGPQIGFVIKDNISQNYNIPFIEGNDAKFAEKGIDVTWNNTIGRVNSNVEQETMSIQKKFDYGIAVGAGAEWDVKKIGRFALTARYYFGLGNLFNSSKADKFSKSANGTIQIKLGYLIDLDRFKKHSYDESTQTPVQRKRAHKLFYSKKKK